MLYRLVLHLFFAFPPAVSLHLFDAACFTGCLFYGFTAELQGVVYFAGQGHVDSNKARQSEADLAWTPIAIFSKDFLSFVPIIMHYSSKASRCDVVHTPGPGSSTPIFSSTFERGTGDRSPGTRTVISNRRCCFVTSRLSERPE